MWLTSEDAANPQNLPDSILCLFFALSPHSHYPLHFFWPSSWNVISLHLFIIVSQSKLPPWKLQNTFQSMCRDFFIFLSPKTFTLNSYKLCRFSKHMLLFYPPWLLIQGSYSCTLPHSHIMSSPFRPSFTRTSMQSFLGPVQSNLPLLCFLCNLYLYVCCFFQVSCHGKIP